MKLKKVISVLLVGAMAAAMLAGCGGSTEEEPATGGGEAAGGSAGGAVSAGGETGGVYFDEPETIDMYGLNFYGDAGKDAMMEEVNKISSEAINVTVNYTPMDVATYQQQIGLMLSGGESFDLVMATAIPTVSFSTMQSQNQLTDITDLLPEYAPQTTALMEEWLPGTTVDGRIYGVPCYRIYNSSYYIIMRKDVLDELGLLEEAKAIDSWSAYEALLLKVKEGQDQLPDNMKTNAVISNQDNVGTIFTGQYVDIGADKFADNYGFDALSDTNKIIYVDDQGKVQNYFASEDYKATVERARKWYEEGLVYKDAATSPDTGDTLMKNGITFSYVVLSEIGVEAAKTAATEHEVIAVPICDAPVQTSVANQWAWCVPVTSEKPEAAVAFMELMYTNPDIENLFVYGVEGKDWENVDGEAAKTENFEWQSEDFFWANQFNALPKQGTGADFRKEAADSLSSAEVSPYFGCTVNTDPIANELTAVVNVLAKYQGGLNSGTTEDTEGTLKTMIDEMEASGVQTILDHYQEQLDAWKAAQ